MTKQEANAIPITPDSKDVYQFEVEDCEYGLITSEGDWVRFFRSKEDLTKYLKAYEKKLSQLTKVEKWDEDEDDYDEFLLLTKDSLADEIDTQIDNFLESLKPSVPAKEDKAHQEARSLLNVWLHDYRPPRARRP